METQYEVDIDNQRVRFEGEWLGRSELADKIRKMIDSQDFRIGMAGAALEFLQNSISNARQVEVRMTSSEVDLLERHSNLAGISMPAFVRQAIQAYLAAQAPLDEEEPRPVATTTITTEPVKPGDEAQVVELTTKKDQSSSKVLVDPEMKAENHPPDRTSDEIWYKK